MARKIRQISQQRDKVQKIRKISQQRDRDRSNQWLHTRSENAGTQKFNRSRSISWKRDKKGNFQQNPAGKDCTSANFRALASKIEKVFDAKWVEACREPDGTIWSDGSTKQEHAEKEKIMLEVEANVLEPYKAKEGDSSYHATAFTAALTELTSHSVVTPLDILKEFINRTFRDDLDNEEFENVVVTLFGDASSSNGHVVHSLSDHEDSMKALFAELLVINRCNEGWLVALAYLCVVPC